ncbi:MAG: hypothetical protein N2109_07790 [Fimbriimonadales bacterium]|nr:hypothetical protein [Fimbriimonadales bacterium]
MDILRMLDTLNELAVEKPRSFGPICWGLNKEEVAMQIAKVRASLPTELKSAVQTVREKDRMLENAREDATQILEEARREAARLVADAQKEAERIREEARIQQERMVSENEVLRLAKAQAEEMVATAERDARELRREADAYAYNLLGKVENVLTQAINSVQRGKGELQKPVPTEPVSSSKDSRR